MKLMCDHVFFPTQKNNRSYCTNCGCISINNIPFTKPQRFIGQITEDPMIYFQKSIAKEKHKCQSIISLSYSLEYRNNRAKGIQYIQKLIIQLEYDQRVLHKAVLYMDLIYVDSDINVEIIQDIATICVLMALQYNENCTCVRIHSLFSILKEIQNFSQLEIYCIKKLDYDLGHLSTYDYLINLFKMGITNNNNIDEVEHLYKSCLVFLNNLIEDERFLDFIPSQLAFSIIKCKVGRNCIFSLEDFSFAYEVNFSEEKYKRCTLVLRIIEKYQCMMNKHYQRKYLHKMNSNSSCSTVDSYELKI